MSAMEVSGIIVLTVVAYCVGEIVGRRAILKRWVAADEVMARLVKTNALKEKAPAVSDEGSKSSDDATP